MPVPRTKGAVSGLLLILLGLWGGLIPFIGPYIDLSLGPDEAWTWTEGRLWLSVLPAAAVVLGGLLVLRSATRGSGVLGSWLAIAGGAWFVAGSTVSKLWNDGVSQGGVPHGSTEMRVLAELSYYHGLGALVLLIAGLALGRFATRSVRDVELVEARRDARLEEGTDERPTRVAERREARREDRPAEAERPVQPERPAEAERPATTTEPATTSTSSTQSTAGSVAAAPVRPAPGARRPGLRRRLLPKLRNRSRG
jgi:hypothetical protein